MPTVAPYRPVSPAGSPQPPFDSVPRGQLLSMRPPTMGDAAESFVDRTSPDPRRARWGGVVEAARSVEREHQPRPGGMDPVFGEAAKYREAQLAKFGPAPPSPSFDISEAPEKVEFGDWLVRMRPGMAGKQVPKHVADRLYQDYAAWQSARGDAYKSELTRSAQRMRAAEITARADRRPTRGELNKEFDTLDAIRARRAKSKKEPKAKSLEGFFVELIRQANPDITVAALTALKAKWREAGQSPKGDDMDIVRGLASAARRIQQDIEAYGKPPSADEQKVLELYAGAIARLATQIERSRQSPFERLRPAKTFPQFMVSGEAAPPVSQTGRPPPSRFEGTGKHSDANLPSAGSQLMGPSTPGAALPAGASSPFGAAGQPTAGPMGGAQPTMDDEAQRRLVAAFQRGEVTREEMHKYFRITGYKPWTAP